MRVLPLLTGLMLVWGCGGSADKAVAPTVQTAEMESPPDAPEDVVTAEPVDVEPTTSDAYVTPPNAPVIALPADPIPADDVAAAKVASEDFSANDIFEAPPVVAAAVMDEPEPGDGFSAIDRLLDQMPIGNAVFTPPRRMQYGERRIVELVVGTEDLSVEELQSEITTSTNIQTEQLRVSEEMSATLTGEGFLIEALNDEVQPLSRRRPTKWEWQITPTEYGEQVLHLSVQAVLTVPGKEPRKRRIETFREEIEVEISLVKLAGLFVVQYWQWFVASILLPIGLWWVKQRRKSSAA